MTEFLHVLSSTLLGLVMAARLSFREASRLVNVLLDPD